MIIQWIIFTSYMLSLYYPLYFHRDGVWRGPAPGPSPAPANSGTSGRLWQKRGETWWNLFFFGFETSQPIFFSWYFMHIMIKCLVFFTIYHSIIFDGSACMFQSLGISELLSTSSTGVVFQVGGFANSCRHFFSLAAHHLYGRYASCGSEDQRVTSHS